MHIKTKFTARTDAGVCPRGIPPRRDGFTLIELLVVLVIIGLVTAIVAPSLVHTPSTEIRSAAHSLASGLRSARSLALTRNRAATLTLDVEQRWYRVAGDKREHALPEAVGVSLYTARSELQGDKRGAIRFYPDGESTGARITLTSEDLAYAVDVDWMTGRVRILEGEASDSREFP